MLGSGILLMAHAHVGHNTVIRDRAIIANGVAFGGHVVVGDRAFAANCLIHQFVRVGTLALMQGGSAISKDLPPFCVSRGDNGLCGLNVIGLRRAGLDGAARLELRRIYHAVFRSGRRFQAAVQEAESLAVGEAGRQFLEFLRTSRRGVLAECRRPGLVPGDDAGSLA